MKNALQYALQSSSRTEGPIRVMLVDDSAVARSIFARILNANEDIEIVCEASDADAALLGLAKTDVDIILLDIEMPRRSGLDALPEILAKSDGAQVIILSAFAVENGPAAIQALSLGACDTLAKPGRTGFAGSFSKTLVEKVVRLGRSERARSAEGPEVTTITDCELSRPACVAIGASTGGIPAISTIIGRLSSQLDCPIFITQHLPDAFMSFFARQLGGLTSRKVMVAKAGTVVRKNCIYIAPGEAHLVCRREGTQIIIDCATEYSDTRYCPSVDAMFESIARTYEGNAVAILLSGMGNDGARGSKLLRQHGATILVQDMKSSVVWGMPGAVAREGIANAVLDPSQMSRFLEEAATR